MGIRAGFSLSLAVGSLLVAVAAFSFGFNQFMVTEAVSENKTVDSIFTEGMQLVQLTNEVLLYGQPRAVAQWRSQYDKMARLSARGNLPSDPAAAEFLGRVAANVADMRPLFDSLVDDGGKGGSAERARAEVGGILSSQLFRKSTLLQTSLRELKDASEDELTRIHAASKRRLMLTFALFASLIGLFGFAISVKFRNFVLRPIQNLGTAIRHVNEGRLEERAPVVADDEIGIVCHAFNGLLDQQAKHRQELQFLAYHDVLTGLPNQLLVADRINRAMAYANRTGSKIALLFLDLDNFKAINDSLGHPVGDGLLQQVAMRLTGCIRDTDTVGRKGGDEFIVVLSSVRDAEDIAALAHKILETLAAPIEVANHDLSTSASIGIAIYPDDSDNFDTLLKMADTALYQAKAAGRNAYRFFTEQMNEASSEYCACATACAAPWTTASSRFITSRRCDWRRAKSSAPRP
jgi:diguanylate cyclase (GGDEF)-like protein